MRHNLLTTLLDELLAVAVAALTPIEDDEADVRTAPPERQFVAHGSFAWDCEQLVSHLVALSLQTAPSSGGSRVAPHVPTATLAVTLLRCYPTPTQGQPIPTAEEIDTAAGILAVDAAALVDGILEAHKTGALFSGFQASRVRVQPGVDPLGPSGGFAGWRVSLDVTL